MLGMTLAPLVNSLGSLDAKFHVTCDGGMPPVRAVALYSFVRHFIWGMGAAASRDCPRLILRCRVDGAPGRR